MERQEIGKAGEEYARKFLIAAGYKILGRNYYCRFGEIDIIAKKARTICFVEVKSLASGGIFDPFQRVTKAKMRNIIKVAKLYLRRRKIEDHFIRFDVIGIVAGKITHMEDAFREERR